jgi:hypothetical protein
MNDGVRSRGERLASFLRYFRGDNTKQVNAIN